MAACNALGCGAWNVLGTPATPATIPDVAPIAVSAGYPGTSTLISGISSGGNGGSALTSYLLYRRSATVASCASSCAWGLWAQHANAGIAANYTDTGLSTTMEYTYGIQVTNAMGTTIQNNVGGSVRG
jgi:hypothetical protein